MNSDGGQKVRVDFGCGELTDEKRRRYARYLGEYNPDDYLKIDVTQAAGVDLVYAAGEPLPLATESIDEIICIHVLEHIRELEPVLKELHRVLKPGGTLRIWVPHCFSPVAFGAVNHVHFFTYETFFMFDTRHSQTYEFDFHFTFVRSRMQVFRRWYSPHAIDRFFEWAINANQRQGERFLKILPYKDWEVYTELQKEP